MGPQFKQIIQCDGYGAYRAHADWHDDIQLSGCWAHARFKFHDALEQKPLRAGWLLQESTISTGLKRGCAKTGLGRFCPRLCVHTKAVPSLERLRKALVLFKAGRQHLPQSLLGKAPTMP